MKNILYALLLLSLIFSCADDKKNDLTRHNLNGNVKSTYEVSFEAIEKFGEITKGSNRQKYYIDNFEQWHVQNEYDDNGNRIERNIYSSDGELIFKYICEHDDNGNSIEQNRYNSEGKLDEKWTSKFDAKGNEIKSNLFNSESKLVSKYTFEYDDKENMIEMNYYNYDDELISIMTYEFDDNGNLIEENKYDKDGELEDEFSYEYKFDDKENWIQKTIFEDDKPTFIIEREIKYYD